MYGQPVPPLCPHVPRSPDPRGCQVPRSPRLLASPVPAARPAGARRHRQSPRAQRHRCAAGTEPGGSGDTGGVRGVEEGSRGWRRGARTELGTGMEKGCRTQRGGAGAGEGVQGWRRGAGDGEGEHRTEVGCRVWRRGAGSGEEVQDLGGLALVPSRLWGSPGWQPLLPGDAERGWAWGGGLGFPPGAGSPAQEILPGSLSSPSLCAWDF